MDILMTGSLSSATAPLFEKITAGHTVAVACPELVAGRLGRKVTPFQISPGDERFEKIFHSYNFRVAVFFGQSLFAEKERYEEYQELANCLRICSEHDVSQFLYIRPKLAEEREGTPDSNLGTLFQACDALCDYYRKRRVMSVLILNIPELYGYREDTSVIGCAVSEAKSKAAVHFHGGKEQRIGLLSQKDMGELLLRVLENWTNEYESMDVPPADQMTFEELGRLFQDSFPTLRVSYQANPAAAKVTFSGKEVRREYDWIPLLNLEDELPEVIAAQERSDKNEKRGFLARAGNFIREHGFIVKLVELVIGFFLMEFLNRATQTTIQFQYIDFRLLYIVLMGTLHGMRTGLAAAAFASLSLLASMIQNHSNWRAIAYNMDTWLPFIFFFLIGAVTGYVKDRLRKDNQFLKEEEQQLEEKYVLLNEFYLSAIQNKNRYKTQIMSYRNSFGRLFDIVKNMDSTLVEEVFYEALGALEDILDNHSVCIYRCQDMNYGRLLVCSKEISNVVDKTLKLGEMSHMTAKFKEDEVWVNRECLVGYPEYAFPVYQDGQFIALITLQKASYEQMATYYENMVRIVCGIIKISLVRAIKYTDQINDEMYLPGTRILTNRYFSENIKIKEKMAQSGVSEYMLLHFHTTPETRDDIANRIQRVIRSTDMLGLGKDGELYLALSQTNQSNIRFILRRLEAIGVECHEIDGEDAV